MFSNKQSHTFGWYLSKRVAHITRPKWRPSAVVLQLSACPFGLSGYFGGIKVSTEPCSMAKTKILHLGYELMFGGCRPRGRGFKSQKQ